MGLSTLKFSVSQSKQKQNTNFAPDFFVKEYYKKKKIGSISF